jgi:hypothetical protein
MAYGLGGRGGCQASWEDLPGLVLGLDKGSGYKCD